MPDPDDRFTTCREILKWHYRHRRPEFLGEPRRHYSLHYAYSQDDQVYLASKVRRERGRVPFSRQFVIMRALEQTEAGSVVRPPLATQRRSGGDWVTGPRNRWFVRYYTDHDRRPDWLSPSLVADAARKLALVHRSANVINRDRLHVPAHRLRVYDWGMFDVLRHIGPIVDDMWWRGRNVDQVMAVATRLTRLSTERAGLYLGPEGLTHHDLRPENLLVRDAEVVEIVDWDRAHWDVQWYDVTLAGLHLAYVRPADPRWNLTQVFLDSYRAEADIGLTPDALAWMFRFTAVRNLAVSRSPEKWSRILRDVEEHWGDHALSVR